MQQATFTISGSEFNLELIEKIKSLFNGNSQDFEVVIRIKPKESHLAMKKRIDQSIKNLEAGENVVSFSVQEYETLVQNLTNK